MLPEAVITETPEQIAHRLEEVWGYTNKAYLDQAELSPLSGNCTSP
jgi:hypothetical protein